MTIYKPLINCISLIKTKEEAPVSIYIKELSTGVVEILYVLQDVVHRFVSATLLAPRMISALVGVDYEEVNKAMAGVA